MHWLALALKTFLWSACCGLLKVRSHQTRMKRYTQIIYMLSQCKDAIDNPAALSARMRRELINLNFGGYSRRVNQSGVCSSSDVITSGGSKTTMEDKLIWLYVGTRQGSKLRPFWSHMLPKCNLCDSKIYLGAFVRVQIIAVVRPLQFSAKRSRITARMCHVTGS